MSDIRRFKKTKEKAKRLRTMLKHETFMGAGLSIGISVGSKAVDDCYAIEAELTCIDSTKAIVKSMLEGVEDSIKFQEALLKAELKALTKLFNEEE